MEILMSAGVPRRREGGVAAIVYNLGQGLEELGHHVEYIFYEDLLTPAEMDGRFRDVRFAVRLARHIRKNRGKYSVVNLHAPVGFAYGVSRALLPSNGVPPYVMMLHGLEERRLHVMRREVKKGRAWHFTWQNRLWHRIYHRPRYDLSIKTADRAHCYSRDVWTILQLKYNLDSDKVRYIPSGVEERFFIERNYAERKPVRLLYAGTWLDQRGIFYLRDALNALNAKFRDWKFSIVGSGVAEKDLKDFFGESLREQILALPATPAEQMPQVYAEHDIFVFPSLMEGLPGVLLEAMASGMPVITTETCGMPDMVEDGWNGLLIPPADAEAIEEAISKLCKCADLRQQLGRAAQDSMRRLSWKNSAAKLERLLVSALQDAGRDVNGQ